MGFLENLLKKEGRKIISGVMDAVVDNVMDSAKDAINQRGSNTSAAKSTSQSSTGSKGSAGYSTASKVSKVDEDEEDCGFDTAVVEARIRKVLESDFSGLELRSGIACGTIGVNNIFWKYTYGVYKEGVPVAMINLLEGHNDYKRRIILQSRQGCADQGIGYVHFIMHLPNRISYIREQLKKIIPA